MNEFAKLFGDVSLSQIILILLAGNWVLKFAANSYKKITAFHDELQKREQILSSIECLSAQIQKVEDRLGSITEESRDYRRTSLHDKITKGYIRYKAQGDITHSQLENFKMCLDKYYSVGGNGLVKSKIEAEIFALPVRDE